jgi:hypothetical protein
VFPVVVVVVVVVAAAVQHSIIGPRLPQCNISILVYPLLAFSDFLCPVEEFISQQKSIYHPKENY